jgi:phage terminase small subunit
VPRTSAAIANTSWLPNGTDGSQRCRAENFGSHATLPGCELNCWQEVLMPVLRNTRREKFCLAILEGKTATEAHALAGYITSTPEAAWSASSLLFRNVTVAARIAELKAAAETKAVMSAAEVLEKLSRIGRSSMGHYIKIKGGQPVLDFSKLTPEQASVIAELTIESRNERGAEEGAAPTEVTKVRFRLADQLVALDRLARHHGLLAERVQHEFVGLGERLARARALDEEERARAVEDRSASDTAGARNARGLK